MTRKITACGNSLPTSTEHMSMSFPGQFVLGKSAFSFSALRGETYATGFWSSGSAAAIAARTRAFNSSR